MESSPMIILSYESKYPSFLWEELWALEPSFLGQRSGWCFLYPSPFLAGSQPLGLCCEVPPRLQQKPLPRDLTRVLLFSEYCMA